MNNRKRNFSVLTITWSLTQQLKGNPIKSLYSGNGIRLLEKHNKDVLRWWSITLTITSSEKYQNDKNQLLKQNITFRPANKLKFQDLIKAAADYVNDFFSEEEVSLFIDVIALAVVCRTQPVT